MPLKPPPGFHPVAVPAGFHPVASASPMATVSAAPKPGIADYLGEMEQDVEHGGRRTILGKVLGYLQGRGSEGYQSPGTSGAASILMSPIEAPLKMLHGGAEIFSGHPLQGLKTGIGGDIQALSLPSMFVGPEAGATGQEIESVLGIPTKTHAGQILDEIGEAAGRAGTTVPTEEMVPALQEWRSQLEAGGKPGGQKAVQSLSTKILGTVRRPIEEAESIPFGEAQTRYSHIAEQQREPILQKLMGRGMSPKMKAAASGVQSALREGLSQGASEIGMQPQFESAMAEYRHAAQLAKAARIAGMIGLGELARSSGLLGRILPHYLPDKQ